MRIARIALALSLVALPTGCGYTWQPLRDAALENYPFVGRVRLHTSRGSYDLEAAKVTPAGVQGERIVAGRKQRVTVPLTDIQGGAVHEPEVQIRRRVLVGFGVALGVTLNTILLSVSGLHQPSYDGSSF